MPQQRPRQPGIAQHPPPPGERRIQQRPRIIGRLDRQREPLPRRRHPEPVALLHVHERRNIEPFVAALVLHIGPRCRNQIGMPLPKGVVHLIHHRLQRPIRAVAEIDSDRVEHHAEHPRHAQHPNAPTLWVQPRPTQHRGNLLGQRRAGPIAMVTVPEGEHRPPVMPEQPQPPRQLGQFIQVQQHRQHAIAQPVPHRPQPHMRHAAAIQRRGLGTGCGAAHAASLKGGMAMRGAAAGIAQGRRTPPSCSATARPDCSPSS